MESVAVFCSIPQPRTEELNMTELVLDSSALRAIPKTVFDQMTGDYQLLITQELGEELYTHTRKQSKHSTVDSSQYAYHLLAKIINSGQRLSDDYIRYEVEQNLSSRTIPREKLVIPTDVPIPSNDEVSMMLKKENAAKNYFSFEHPQEYEEVYRRLQEKHKDEELWPMIAETLASERGFKCIQTEAIQRFSQYAEKNNWNISLSFSPNRDWYTFGTMVAHYAYCTWKYAKHGDQALPEPNHAFDMKYIAHIAIADGLLSCDKNMLNVAWACFPEKRKNIMTYDHEAKKIVTYCPSWCV